jgi:hypothetical protein
MATCEYILDIANYKELPPQPTDADKVQGDAYVLAKQRAYDLALNGNRAKQQFALALLWFLEQEFKFDKIKPKSLKDIKRKEPSGWKIDHADGIDENDKARLFVIAGLLMIEGQNDPLCGKNRTMLSAGAGDVIHEPDDDDYGAKDANTHARPYWSYIAAPFKTAMSRALSEFRTYPALFVKVYDLIRQKSETTPDHFKFQARQIAVVGRAMVGTDPDDPQFEARFERALSQALSGATDGKSSVIDIDLPDLDAGTEADIIADNVNALSAIYFSAMLEELKFFSVMDKVVEQFMNGALPIKRSGAGDPLYKYHRDAQTRINEFERRGLYARSFGVAQGSVDEPLPNREFNDVWIRFLSAVSMYGREIKSTDRRLVSPEQVFKTARDLGVNLSLHGFGLAHFAAIELQTLIKSIKDTLSNPDVLSAYGVRDVWQLVERVSNMYLGGAVNGVRQRTMATSGAGVIQWIAQSAPSLVGSFRNLLVDDQVISHVERWLAVTGTPDAAVEKYSEPVALQNQRTIPDFALPSGAGAAGDAIRDALNRVNLPTTPQA